jgi:hypothetical protein
MTPDQPPDGVWLNAEQVVPSTVPVCDELGDEDLRDVLLAGLVKMAEKSKRRQADLNAVLQRGRFNAPATRVLHALGELETIGCIRDMVPLYDGGMLVTVTNIGMDLLGRSAQWRFLQDVVTLAA